MGRRHSPLPVYFQNQYMYTYFLRIIIWNTAWEREECWLAEVCPDVRTLLPCWINRNTSSALSMCSSLSPTTFTCPLWSSNTRSFIFLLSKSKTCWESRNNICFIFSLFPFFKTILYFMSKTSPSSLYNVVLILYLLSFSKIKFWNVYMYSTWEMFMFRFILFKTYLSTVNFEKACTNL